MVHFRLAALPWERLRPEPRRLIEPAVWLALAISFIVVMEITNENAFGYFSQRDGQSLLLPLTLGGLVNAATFMVNAFVLMPHYLEQGRAGRYLGALVALWLVSSVAQTVWQVVLAIFAGPALRDVTFVDFTLVNMAFAAPVIALSFVYKAVRDWARHASERKLLSDEVLRLTDLLNTGGGARSSRGEMLQLSNGREDFQIPLGQIRYMKAASNYVEVHAEARRYLVYGQLKRIEALLPPTRFARIHRSYIVAFERVRTLNASSVTLEDVELPLGRVFRESFLEGWRGWRESTTGLGPSSD
jgi:DNA-binding LytR/AlgR family response regulator